MAMPRFTREALTQVEAYRAGKRVSELRRELGLEEMVKLSSNECPLGPLPRARRAMALGISGLNRYPDGDCRLLKRKLVSKLGVDSGRLAIGNGSNELLRLLAQCVLRPGDEVVMATPSFIVYPIVAKIMESTPVEVPLADFTHDLEAMARAVTERTRLVFVCNPNNPTGTVVGGESLARFIERVPGNVVIAVDEAYHEYVHRRDYRSAVELLDGHQNLAVFRTFSKIYGLAGARIGYCVADPEIIQAIDKVREPFNVNLIGQIGAYYSLDAVAEVDERKASNRREKDFLYQAFEHLGLNYIPSETNFIYADLGIDGMTGFEKLKRGGVIVRAFGHGGWIRVTVGTHAENRRFVEALSEMQLSTAAN